LFIRLFIYIKCVNVVSSTSYNSVICYILSRNSTVKERLVCAIQFLRYAKINLLVFHYWIPLVARKNNIKNIETQFQILWTRTSLQLFCCCGVARVRRLPRDVLISNFIRFFVRFCPRAKEFVIIGVCNKKWFLI